MCRMAAFPPGTTKKDALAVLDDMSVGQVHGTGVAYVKDGSLVVHKWAVPLASVLAQKLPLLDHMPAESWTLVHLRQTSVGEPHKENSHPFIAGDWAFCHNGTWLSYRPVKALLEKMGHKFLGGTDSEVAAHLWDTLGPKGFMKAVPHGVWFALNKDGKLWAYCGEGDLQYRRVAGRYLLSSELRGECTTVDTGWMLLGAKGTMLKSAFKKDPVTIRVYRSYPGSGYVVPRYDASHREYPLASYRQVGPDGLVTTGSWGDEGESVDRDEPPLPHDVWDEMTAAEKSHYLKEIREQEEADARKRPIGRSWEGMV